jgi:hypothetical protein
VLNFSGFSGNNKFGREGKNVANVPIAQDHRFGKEAEVDFGEFWIYLAGVRTKVYLFALRLSASGKAFHRAYATCAQEAFFDGHVRAFERFGGVPKRCRYDNLKPAVIRVLIGRDRLESERFVVLRSHYRFDSFYCIPGKKGAHEKGGVEGDIGRFRRNHLVPVPRVDSLTQLNDLLDAADSKDDHRHIDGRLNTVAQDFACEETALLALPVEKFDASVSLFARVDQKSRISVRHCHYSVPVALVGKRLLIKLGPTHLDVVHEGKVVTTHERATKNKSETLLLDHYLETLEKKPGAFIGSTALTQARTQGVFSPTHDRFLSQARRKLGDKAGTKAMIDVLLLHRHYGADVVIEGMQKALCVGNVDANVVAIEVRRAVDQDNNILDIDSVRQTASPRNQTESKVCSFVVTRQNTSSRHGPKVTALQDVPITREIPSIKQYDALLGEKAQ